MSRARVLPFGLVVGPRLRVPLTCLAVILAIALWAAFRPGGRSVAVGCEQRVVAAPRRPRHPSAR